mmetsp:Transcript_80159/g.141439  ORF Transcript_80159/g.141439 Transcript_80159/m.141439 type:complete len:418 (+) Transcript_80159:85-1338(+)
MPMRVGFILGKEFDFVDTPGSVVDTSFLDDLPSKYRERSDKPRMTWPGMNVSNKDNVSVDVAIAWYIHKNYPDIEVDFVLPGDISLERLQSNLCNFITGYDILDAMVEGPDQLAKVTQAFKHSGNIMPSWEVQEAIYMKSIYMKEATKAGVPVAPTIFAGKERSAGALLQEIKARGWKTFILKQSYSCGSIGFTKLQVEECEQKPEILEEYFETYSECPEFVVQEFVEGFCRNWEVRCFWFNDEFLYAMANRAAVSQSEGEKVGIITGDEIPAEFLENAKRIGKEALKSLPQLTTPNGHPIGMTCVRTDIGCSDSEIYDKDYDWDPKNKTFFLNEIEYGGTTYFARALKFDCIPLWAELYASKSREIHEKMSASHKIEKGGYQAKNHVMEHPTTDTLDGLEGTHSGNSEASSDSDAP